MKALLVLAVLVAVLSDHAVARAQTTGGAPAGGAPAGGASAGGSAQTTSTQSAGGGTRAVQTQPPAAGGAPQQPHAATSPHGKAGMGPAHPKLPEDESAPADDLPQGTVVARIEDSQGRPRAGIPVHLGVMFQSIALGNKQHEITKTSDNDGSVRFDGLEGGTSHNYRVSISEGPAEYATPPFMLQEGKGHRVLLHSYPYTADPAEAAIWLKGIVYISPRDDLFEFDVVFRVFNLSATSWVPSGVTMRLPKGFKAFRASESMSDTRFEEVEAHGAELLGTFSPGQHNASFRFQVPSDRQNSAVFGFESPVRTGEMRVISEVAPGMSLKVDGWEPTQVDTTTRGQRVEVTRRLVRRRGEQVREFLVRLDGIPVPGSSRWVALALAMAISGYGVFSARRPQNESSKVRSSERTFRQARRLLLDELLRLKQARAEGRLGPRSFEQAQTTLVDALARLQLAQRRHATQ